MVARAYGRRGYRCAQGEPAATPPQGESLCSGGEEGRTGVMDDGLSALGVSSSVSNFLNFLNFRDTRFQTSDLRPPTHIYVTPTTSTPGTSRTRSDSPSDPQARA